MYCPSCGKAIVDDSRYCSYCGKPVGKDTDASVAQAATARIIPSDQPPAFIDWAGLQLFGPMKDRAGKDKFGVGFRFSLRDKNNNPTRATGRAELEISANFLFGKTLRFSFDFHKDDFKQMALSNKTEVLLYEFKQVEPLLSAGEYYGKINLVMSDGLKISGSSFPEWARL